MIGKQKQYLAKAFVLHMGANGLGITRSLGRVGVPVVGVDFERNAPGLYSRFCEPLVIPNPLGNPEKALDVLMARGEELETKGVIMAASDIFLLFLSRYRNELSKHFSFVIPREEIVEGINNKKIQYELAKRIGIPIPRTVFPDSNGNLKEEVEGMQYPLFIKPCISHLFSQKFAGKGFIAQTFDELRISWQKIRNAGVEAMIQEVVQGPETNLFGMSAYFNRNGQMVATYLNRKIRQYPPDFGVASIHESMVNQEVMSIGIKYFQGLDYRGMGGVEFKFDQRDRRYKLIELNLRTGMQNINTTASGINFALIRYLDAIGEELESPPEQVNGVRWADAIADFKSFLIRKKRGDTVSILAFMKDWLTADTHAFYAINDPLPLIVRSEFGIAVMHEIVTMGKSAHRKHNPTLQH
ncbi:MAG: hypothetical protein QHH00_00200 [Methanomassiliicoccales archaeon]|jgi:predicted ATP-grasp superfamily ATP-dependent carboligase|nr:hypothetical protein [Methanomassiliicoccales archaeon]